MTKPVVFTWPANDTSGVATSQVRANPNTYVTLRSPIVSFGGASRHVTLTSGFNLQIPVVITGTYRNQVVSETLTGPNNNTVTSVNLYDTVTSVFIANSGEGIAVGYGLGHTPWVPYSFNTNVLGSGVQVAVTGNAGTITYNVATTFDDVYATATPAITSGVTVVQPNNVEPFTVIMNGAATNANTVLVATDFLPKVYGYICIQISAQAANFNGSLIFSYIQQGVSR